MTTKLALERLIENKDNQWILESLITTLKTGSRSASTATSTVIWQRNARQRRRNKKYKLVLNATRRGTLPKIVKGSRR